MCPADIVALLIVLILVTIVYKGWGIVDPRLDLDQSIEHMAPLDFGTYELNYPRGECRTGRFLERTECEIGNCPLGTTVTDKEYCSIQCAQDPDPVEREECFNRCMNSLC